MLLHASLQDVATAQNSSIVYLTLMRKKIQLVALATPHTAVVSVMKEDWLKEIESLRAKTAPDEDFSAIKDAFVENMIAEAATAKSGEQVACIDSLGVKEEDGMFVAAGIVWFVPFFSWKPRAPDTFKKIFIEGVPGSAVAIDEELKLLKLQYRMNHNVPRKVGEDYLINEKDAVQAVIVLASGGKIDSLVLFDENSNDYVKELLGKKVGDVVPIHVPSDILDKNSPRVPATIKATAILDLPVIESNEHYATLMKMNSIGEVRDRLRTSLVNRRTAGFAEAFQQFVGSSSDMGQPPTSLVRSIAEQDFHNILAVRKEADVLKAMGLPDREALLMKLTEVAASRYIQQLGALNIAHYLGIDIPEADPSPSPYVPQYRHRYRHQLSAAMAAVTRKVRETVQGETVPN